MMADEASSEFRPKIASLQNGISSYSSRRWHSSGAPQHNKLGADDLSREALESKKTDNTPLFHFVPYDDLKYADILGRFFNIFFQGFVV
jgi:hypothetical protein